MIDQPAIPELLVATAVLLALAATGGVIALRLQKQQARVNSRIDSVTVSHARVKALTETQRSSRKQVEPKLVLHQLGRLFGYDSRRIAEYPVRWWVAIPASVVLARLAAQLVISLFGWVALAAVPVMALLISRAFYTWCLNRRKRKLFAQFPDVLAMIVRGVRVGVPVAESMRTVARESAEPTAGEFREVADRVSLGAPLEDALYAMAERCELAEYRFFATAIGLQSQTGGALSETLDNLAEVIRKRVALRARGYALASEARASIVILCAMPIITGIAISIINPDYIGQLFNNDLGKKVFAAAVISFTVGLGVMQVIVKKSLS